MEAHHQVQTNSYELLIRPFVPSTHVSETQGNADEVSWDDQQNICAFGRLNTRLHEVNAELKAKSVRTYPTVANWDPTKIDLVLPTNLLLPSLNLPQLSNPQ